MDGPGPGETLVAVTTSEGRDEEVIVHRTSVTNDTIEIGYPIDHDQSRVLVELPQEAMSGTWRVWVPRTAVA